MIDVKTRCLTPGCGHHWPAHSDSAGGATTKCTVSGCACQQYRPASK